jgi:photosystem II stability/assembly factor-like uncharacterized protein
MRNRVVQARERYAVVAGAAFLLTLFVAVQASAQAVSPEVLAATTFRSIGPMQQSGRFVDVAVPELEPTTIYMATASGGLWKSVNNGISWESIFDNQPVIALGDIAVAPSNPSIVYVGTGEHTSSRSTYWGDGVYKSTDAGKTWTNVGLADTHHIGRVVIDPKNPDIVYVAALGHLYSANAERGVYKTIDGGKTWTKSLAVKADGRDVGACDLAMDPKNPKVLYAAAYDKERKPWTFNLAGPGSGIYKTVDAGKTWTKLTTGLPGGMLGRIGLAVYPKDPNIVYANIENANKPGVSDQDRLKELREGKSSEGMVGEEVYRSSDAGKTWHKVNEKSPSPRATVGGGPGYYYMQIRVDPNDANHVYVLTVGVLESKDGGKTWQVAFRFGGDNHAMWIDPANSKHMILGYDHGMGITYDGGAHWYHPDELPLAQLYAIGIDYAVPYNVYGGIQDNGSIRGPSTRRDGNPIVFEDWQSVGGGDGMYNVVDPATNRYLYNESQFGSIARVDLLTGERKGIAYPDQTLRYNWTAPILVSPYDGNTIYHAANKLLKSTSRGDSWVEISPDLTTNDTTKLTVPTKTRSGAVVYKGGDGNIQYCTITTIDESPIVRDLLYVGTDDGNVWVTKDGGKNWTKLNDKIKGNPGYWVSRVIASRHFPGTAYVAYTGLRNDDFRPFLYRTTDYGETWTSIAGNLPNKSINVIREDPKNPNLLFAGVDFGLYVSVDGGATWTEMKGLPTQPVHDLLIHPRENDLVVATHGRGFFIADISVLEQTSTQVLAQDAYLFDVEPRVKWIPGIARAASHANVNFVAPSEPNGMVINYYLKAPAQGDVVVQVMQGARVVAETKRPAKPGIDQVMWNMRWTPMSLAPEGEQQARRGGRFGRGAQEPTIPTFGGTVAAEPGEYTIVVKAGNRTLSRDTRILEDAWFERVF